MCASTETTDTTIYDGICFQEKTGRLTMTVEKMVFRQTCDPSATTRSWLWPSIKKAHVVVDSKQGKKYLLKISNHNNKAVSFIVAEDVVYKLQEDITARIAAARDLTQLECGTETKRKLIRHASADATLHQTSQHAQTTKIANSTAKQPGEATIGTAKQKKKETQSKEDAASGAAAIDKTKQSTTKPIFTRPKLQVSKSASSATPSASGRSQKAASLRSSATASSRPGKVTLLHATKVITQDLIVKPSQQAIHDYCVNPTNNLIVKPTKRNIIDPAQEKIIKPAQEKIIQPTQEKAKEMILKPATELIVKPAQNAAQKILLPPKTVAQEIGILSRNEPETEDDPETKGDESLTASSHNSKRHSFLHFLKPPPRRTFSNASVGKEDVATLQEECGGLKQ